jgi:hypothetical protein
MFKEGDGKTLPVPKLNNFWTFKGFEGDGSIYIRKTAVDPNFISPEMTVPRKLDASERPFLVSNCGKERKEIPFRGYSQYNS